MSRYGGFGDHMCLQTLQMMKFLHDCGASPDEYGRENQYLIHKSRHILFLLTDPRNVFERALVDVVDSFMLLTVFKALIDNGATLELNRVHKVAYRETIDTFACLVRTMGILPEVADCT